MPKKFVDESILKEQKKRIDNPIRRLLSYCKPFKRRLIIGFIALFLSTLLGLMPPYIVKLAIDEAIIPGDTGYLLLLVAVLIGAFAGGSLFQYLQDFFIFTFAQESIFHLRMDTYNHLQKLSLSFFSEQPTGKMMAKLSNDINRLQRFLSATLRDIGRNLLTGLIIGGFLFMLHWKLALVVLIPFPIIGFLTYKFMRKIRPKWDLVRKAVGSVNSRLHDNISNIEVIKGFAREDYESERVKSASQEYRDANVEAISMWSKFFPVVGFIVAIGSVIVLWFGGREVIAGAMSVGTLVAFNGYIWMFYQPMRMLGWLSNSHQRAAASSSRIFGILDEPTEIESEEEAESVEKLDGDIVFENVTFSYEDDEKPATHNTSFSLKSGETLALAGPSGAGKTTLVNLLLRFYDPDEGTIRVDGKDIRDFKLREYRKRIGIVSQDIHLFDGTIRENISYGDPDSSEDEIIEAAKKAAAHEFIEDFPEGYEAEVGEDGVKLSGGQKQRISIARAVLNDPDILILDEATSDVDTITEVKIQKAIRNLIKNRTTLVIAHDLSTARAADRILVLDKGEIVERGSHDELLERGGLYKRLWEMQSSLDEPGSVEFTETP
ncbi:hypothetical protein AKJ64_02710 [candidate division MSBL1 archaeon SCGC-AAA259E17]|uniref:ABC transporter n=1 Tax=candidate division MSBL1 archaeon SCGC-AAA259E17 TaxID=1698263 RepID=A0A133UEL2_9EURY|nr:hypothetical protein AKJ64_02710 [candidate division MSBL1 archaeon SCGC-AAA259E17]